ncbi:hypothetical protein ABW20_dc0101530 [Dactylellina cionopaga]|nr:hypothetical protein ABW20_dc0101530 [Dactylellina cionopaga]
MVAYKKSASALILSAAVVSAQNGTIPYVPEVVDITYTTHCEHAPCEKPAVPHGWEVKTKWCEHGCGPEPTYVPVTECPWETPAPTPACYGAECHKDEIICPDSKTYTHYYVKPTPAPPAPPAPPVYPPKCEGEGCHPMPPPPKCEGEGCYPAPPPKCEGEGCYPPPPPPPAPPVYPPKCEGEGCHPKPMPYPTGTPAPPPPPPTCEGEGCHPMPMPYPTGTPAPPTPPTCEGPHCCPGPYCPEMVTKTYPPTKPEIPCNTTVPPPPMYTGAAVKTAVSGVLAFIAVAFAALL